MPLRLEVPPRSVSGVYTDDRWKHKYALTVRHQNSVQIERFYREDDALTDRQHYIDLGYQDLAESEQNLDAIRVRLVSNGYPQLSRLVRVADSEEDLLGLRREGTINDLRDELERVLSA